MAPDEISCRCGRNKAALPASFSLEKPSATNTRCAIFGPRLVLTRAFPARVVKRETGCTRAYFQGLRFRPHQVSRIVSTKTCAVPATVRDPRLLRLTLISDSQSNRAPISSTATAPSSGKASGIRSPSPDTGQSPSGALQFQQRAGRHIREGRMKDVVLISCHMNPIFQRLRSISIPSSPRRPPLRGIACVCPDRTNRTQS